MINLIKTTVYKNLAKDFHLFNAWKDSECFLNTNIQNVCVLEYELDPDIVQSLSSIDLDLLYVETIKDRIFLKGKKNFAIVLEHLAKPANKLRSFKGILSKEIKKSSTYLEKEIPIENNLTLILAIVDVDLNNVEHLINDYFNDSSTCCIIQNKEDNTQLFDDSFLLSFSKKYINIKNTVTIEYSRLCEDFLKNDQTVFRSGGNRDRILSLQAFVKCS